MKVIKQYTVEDAYSRNDKITTYENGVPKGYIILSDWETPGYEARLQEEGYTKAYNREELAKKVMELEEELKFWKDFYENILQKNQFLYGS